mmetsp:Transcript_21368/g.49685  ORF Transcript_21368/g.49685 Transcript_21368/m.49685 type:complete len:131 (-) Transcript_21368:986-1378(-)
MYAGSAMHGLGALHDHVHRKPAVSTAKASSAVSTTLLIGKSDAPAVLRWNCHSSPSSSPLDALILKDCEAASPALDAILQSIDTFLSLRLTLDGKANLGSDADIGKVLVFDDCEAPVPRLFEDAGPLLVG